MKDTVVLGMIGAGRATELHMQAYAHVKDVKVRYKAIASGHLSTARKAQELYGFEHVYSSLEEMLDDPEIDVIDVCSPPYTHENYVKRILDADKYVICEKPLTGFFGNSDDKVGKTTSRKEMYEVMMDSLDKLRVTVNAHPDRFMYAENFVYAPAVQKAAEIIKKKKSRILCAKGEESLKGSSSPVAGEWSKTGGGTFIRTGSHPLCAILWLKTVEAETHGEDIYVESIIADMAQITPRLNSYEHRHIAADPVDVEDFGTAILTFSDGSKGVVIATDTLLGGSKNYVELYCNDAVINCKITMSDIMSTYFLDEDNLEDVYISEMLPGKTGWNNPFLADEYLRGYVGEMQDFMECIAFNRAPISNFALAYDTVKITYAAYLAGETGERIKL